MVVLYGLQRIAEQTHESLKPYLLEETYEVLDAIDKQNDGELAEELGDLFFRSFFTLKSPRRRGHSI